MREQLSPLTPDQLRRKCDPDSLTFETTAELEPTQAIIGQPRATKALEFGMGLKSKGYNIYAMGSPGTGRSMAIRHFLRQRCVREPVPDDWIYVHNFDAPHRPRPIRLPPGQGTTFEETLAQLIEHVQDAVTQAFESAAYRDAVQALETQLDEQREQLIVDLEQQATEQGFGLQESPAGLVIADTGAGATSGDAPANSDANGEPAKRREAQRALQLQLQSVLREGFRMERDMRDERRKLDEEVAEAALRAEFDPVREQYAGREEIAGYLNRVREDLQEQITRAVSRWDERDTEDLVDLRRYEVNVLVDNSAAEGAPVIVELNPTYENLFGRFEYEMQGNAPTTHFSQIMAGDLHRANDGYLVMYATELMRQRDSWEALKRAIKSDEIEMRPPQSDGPMMANSLWPLPIPMSVKVILLGSASLYFSFFENDEEFSDLFKIRADFSDTMPRDNGHEQEYAEFVAARAREEKLRPFGRHAVARIVEHGSRLAEDQTKLSARFGAIADLIREANYWTGLNGRDVVTAEDVQLALDERLARDNQTSEWQQEEILKDRHFIATSGCVVGQVNGLTVQDIGDFTFGRPGRITARTFMGDAGVIHIEREIDMSGPIHQKGVLTLSAYLGGTYAQHQPLSLNASLTFEQMYGGIEGDSASSAELYALLSSLSGIPIRQGIGVTGSVNQRGEIQPIGSVNEKIEGFFDICKPRGLTGDQGVVIPRANVNDLMLRDDVVESVAGGQFHVWAISTIDEGVELLMGVPAGEMDSQGRYPEGSLHHAVQQRLLEMATELKSFGEGDEQSGSD